MIPLETKPHVRALCLLSGGLDSQLAVCLIRDQGIPTQGIVFASPFFSPERSQAAARQLGIPLHIVEFTNDIVALLEKPKHGFGAGMNPCIDCHARMLQRAGEMLADLACHFIVTGEVLNQRPMSQTSAALALVARESGYPDLILRPLSARLLPETLPERSGWVDRNRLLDLHGRSRRAQLELCRRYGLREYPSPAGGCLLTDPGFCRRLKDLQEHEGITSQRSLYLLRVGRHFRLGPQTKFIVGRNQQDNETLEAQMEPYDLLLRVENVPGPVGLLSGNASEEQLRLAAQICARYSDAPPDKPAVVKVRSAKGIQWMAASRVPEEILQRLRI